MKNAFSHSKHCFTCGKNRPRKNLGYALDTLKTYCNDSNCYEGELLPLDPNEVKEALYNTYDNDFVIALDRILGKPLSTRLQPYLAMHLLKTAEVNQLTSFNEVILFILNEHFKHNEVTNYVIPEWTEETAATKEPEVNPFMEAHKEIEENAPLASEALQEILDDIAEEIKKIPEPVEEPEEEEWEI